MTPRDAALLPRLLLALDTLENEPEILQAVHQIRRILKSNDTSLSKLAKLANSFTDDDAPKISMADDRHDVRVRLRDLGLLLRVAKHPDQVTDDALQAARAGLVEGTDVAGKDIRVLLACLRDLLKSNVYNQVARANGMNGPHSADSLSEAVASVREAVEEMERTRSYFTENPYHRRGR